MRNILCGGCAREICDEAASYPHPAEFDDQGEFVGFCDDCWERLGKKSLGAFSVARFEPHSSTGFRTEVRVGDALIARIYPSPLGLMAEVELSQAVRARPTFRAPLFFTDERKALQWVMRHLSVLVEARP